MYDQKLRDNYAEIKNVMKEIGEYEFNYDSFSYGDVKVRKLCRRLMALLDKQKMLIKLKKNGNKNK